MRNETDIWARMMIDAIESSASSALMDMAEDQEEHKEANKYDFVKVIGDK